MPKLIINESEERAEILIYDSVGEDIFGGGVSAEGFIAELRAIDGSKPVDVRINSPGGSVFDGLTIHNLLREREGDVAVIVDGVAASIASVIAMAGNTIRMPKNARLMIHRPMGPAAPAFGDSQALREAAAETTRTAELLDSVEDDLVSIYADRTGQPAEHIREWMADETWMNGAEAVARGFADELVGTAPALAAFDFSKFRNTPAELMLAEYNEKRWAKARAKMRLTTATAMAD